MLADFASSGLDADDIKALEITTWERKMPGWDRIHPCWMVPYRNLDGTLMRYPIRDTNLLYTRARCLTDPLPKLKDKNGKPKRFSKYSQPTGSRPYPYFPRIGGIDWLKVAADPTRRILLTEGEKKAAKATKEKFPTIGVGGIYSFQSRTRDIEFLPELEAFNWRNRPVYLCYDPADGNSNIAKAELRLAWQLQQRGADVLRVLLPMKLDEFLATRGAAEFEKLLAQAEPVAGWKDLYQRGKGGLLNNLDNAVVALRNAPELKDIFAFDLMEMAVAVTAPIPEGANPDKVSVTDGVKFETRILSEQDLNLMRRWLQREGSLTQIGVEDVRSAISIRAWERSFHPIRNYLRGLKLDGRKKLLSSWLTTYLGVPANEYTRAIGRMFLIQMIARVFEPGCKGDYALVLIDPTQREGKSTVLKVLAGKDHFSDSLPDLDKDEIRVSQHLRGVWLVEIAEFSALKKADAEMIKKFLSKQEEKFTPKFGRTGDVREPRQCVFVITTNDAKCLKDETGNRRLWPVVTGAIDIEALTRDRDQLLAEAFQAYQAGEKRYPDREFEARVFRPVQQAHLIDEPWCEPIAAWLEIAKPVNGFLPPPAEEFKDDCKNIVEPTLRTSSAENRSTISTSLGSC